MYSGIRIGSFQINPYFAGLILLGLPCSLVFGIVAGQPNYIISSQRKELGATHGAPSASEMLIK